MSRFLAKCQCSWTKCSLVARTDQCRIQSSLISFHIPHFPFVYYYTPPCRATFVLLVSRTERGVDAGCRNSQSPHISGFLHVVLLGIGRIVRVCGLLLESCCKEPTMPGLLLGDEFPNFEANTTIGRIKFHDFLGSS